MKGKMVSLKCLISLTIPFKGSKTESVQRQFQKGKALLFLRCAHFAISILSANCGAIENLYCKLHPVISRGVAEMIADVRIFEVNL